MRIRIFFRRLSAAILLALIATAAVADSALTGAYKAEGKTVDGLDYGGKVGIEPHGKGVRLAWALDGGDGYRGLGLQLDDVLGSVYWAEGEQFDDPGIVIYRIDGGRLQGIWMPQGGPEDQIGREDLLGPNSLEGRFEIALGQNPGGRTNYTGYVNVERHGDTFHFHWYAPTDSYVGNGIRIGDIMVVGYALHRPPGTVAYCVRGENLEGVWTHGEDTRLGRETLRRQSGSAAQNPGAKAGSECLPTVAQAWPSESQF